MLTERISQYAEKHVPELLECIAVVSCWHDTMSTEAFTNNEYRHTGMQLCHCITDYCMLY